MRRSRLMRSNLCAAALIVSGFGVVYAAPANAIGGNCSASLQEDEVFGPNKFRARASCSSLQGDSKARAKLVRDGGPDYSGSYFTRLNTSYYTDWYTCYAGCRSAVEIAHV